MVYRGTASKTVIHLWKLWHISLHYFISCLWKVTHIPPMNCTLSSHSAPLLNYSGYYLTVTYCKFITTYIVLKFIECFATYIRTLCSKGIFLKLWVVGYCQSTMYSKKYAINTIICFKMKNIKFSFTYKQTLYTVSVLFWHVLCLSWSEVQSNNMHVAPQGIDLQ